MIRRGPRPADRFTIVANAALEDEALTWRARGVLAYLLGRPEGWSTSADRLSGMSPKGVEGRDSMRSVLAELESAGYIRRQKSQDQRGRWTTALVVYDAPEPQDQADLPAKNAAEPTVLAGRSPARKSAEPPTLEESKNGGSPGVGGPAVGSPAVGRPGAISKKDTKKENKKKSSSPRSVASLPPSGEDLPRKRGVRLTQAQTREALNKLDSFPGPEYVATAASRWNPSAEDAWYLTCEYIEFVQERGWKFSPDGWLKYLEEAFIERERRNRTRAYSPEGVPL